MNNKWLNGALPALLIHSCIGSVYCWSLLKGSIASCIGTSIASIEFAFTLAIFFLGMSAAFGGRFVEKDVQRSSMLSTVCFVLGLLGTVWSITVESVYLLYLSYGVLMGIGLGLGYLSPVKTLMLWFKEHKGLATGIAISGFGLSKVLFSPFFEWSIPIFGIKITLLITALVSFIMMFTASKLIKKPSDWVENPGQFNLDKAWEIIKNPTYISIWLMFFINITCGLVIISFEKNIILFSGLFSVAFMSSLSAFFNTLGRFGYSTGSDYTKKKETIYSIIFITCIISCLFLNSGWGILGLLAFINLGYGGGFSTLPILLENKFGMKNISTIHGFALSAWAWAAVGAFIITQILIYQMNIEYDVVIKLLSLLYLFGFGLSLWIRKR